MKRSIALATICILSPTQAFLGNVAATAVSTRRTAEAPRQAGQREAIAVPIDSRGPSILPKGKRVVRRKKRPQQPSQPAVDISKANVQLVKSIGEYDAVLRDNGHRLVVTKYFAPWCRSCKALDVKYRRYSVTYPEVKFVEVDVHQSPELKKALGVRAVPTVKLHAGSLGQVASFTCGPKRASELERKIKLCKDVPSLARRLGQGGGMMEMVAGEMMGENSDGPVSTQRAASSSSQQPDNGPAQAVAKGLMEKLARQELLAESLQQQLDEFPLHDG